MLYLLDADVLIEANKRHYGMDFCPAFWDWLIDQNGRGKVHSVEQVANEIAADSDDLAKWAVARGDAFFLAPGEDALPAFAAVSTWVSRQSFRPDAVSDFFQAADYYLVAQALTYQCTLVTHEIASAAVKRVKIPNVCIGVKVNCMSPYEMLRSEGARFVLAK